MSDDWDRVAHEYWAEQPHPKAPSLKIGEFAVAVKLATLAKFGGHAQAHEAALFWPEFQATGMSPDEFEHTLDRIAPISFTYHGRPPTMKEIVQLKDKQPREARQYFADLPDKHYPHVSAGDMVKALRSAEPHAQEHLGRPPVKYEAQYLHHSGEAPREYYAKVAAQNQEDEGTLTAPNVLPLEKRGDAGGRSVGADGRPAVNQ